MLIWLHGLVLKERWLLLIVQTTSVLVQMQVLLEDCGAYSAIVVVDVWLGAYSMDVLGSVLY